MKFIAYLIISAAAAFTVAAPKQKESAAVAKNYCNPRFGYCFTYDAHIFNKIPPDVNGDGITLSDSSGTMFIESYGAYNPSKLEISDLEQENLEYLLRNQVSGPYKINEYKDDVSYIVSFETDDSIFKQELVLEKYYYKVLTVKIAKNKKAWSQHIMESTHFVPNTAAASL